MQNNSNISIFVTEMNFVMRQSLFIFLIIFSYLSPKCAEIQGENPSPSFQDESKVSIIVIDAGHGGKDPGAVVGTAREKDIVLDISLKLGAYIKSSFPDAKVIYTRDKDIFVPLYRRAEIANRNDADLFISIHANYVSARSVQGAETFVLGQHRSEDNLEVAKKENSVILLEDNYSTTYEDFDPNSSESYIMFEMIQDEYLEQSVMLASVIQDQFREVAKRYDRSVKQAGFLVLRETTMPSVLVEAGFLSHQSERNYLLSESGRDNIANSIFKAFKEYKHRIEEKSSFNLVTEPEEKQVVRNEKKENSNPILNSYYSVQVAATRRSLDTKPSNFKGEKNIFKINTGKIYKYYSGKFESYDDAVAERKRLQGKFKDAFIVVFEDDKLVSVKKIR
ncbi:N-acetylmuramoyl-L-alanine amidase family protein [Maribellus maritimus]|uniref:N-acetylmuramoyl-L-alanine amidase family protein n=1 Tax=Maribellus maritimus TaxID=2870838 RepID=UPI001EEA677F|nr:N-acetylmuramoyl-L-alanine amidase [Maribellus maritimus]MCG6187628.1 N-acetylmuramoyl-L-alanine amidase [Maribellus maritimus]